MKNEIDVEFGNTGHSEEVKHIYSLQWECVESKSKCSFANIQLWICAYFVIRIPSRGLKTRVSLACIRSTHTCLTCKEYTLHSTATYVQCKSKWCNSNEWTKAFSIHRWNDMHITSIQYDDTFAILTLVSLYSFIQIKGRRVRRRKGKERERNVRGDMPFFILNLLTVQCVCESEYKHWSNLMLHIAVERVDIDSSIYPIHIGTYLNHKVRQRHSINIRVAFKIYTVHACVRACYRRTVKLLCIHSLSIALRTTDGRFTQIPSHSFESFSLNIITHLPRPQLFVSFRFVALFFPFVTAKRIENSVNWATLTLFLCDCEST